MALQCGAIPGSARIIHESMLSQKFNMLKQFFRNAHELFGLDFWEKTGCSGVEHTAGCDHSAKKNIDIPLGENYFLGAPNSAHPL
jgi:hypothetical protein